MNLLQVAPFPAYPPRSGGSQRIDGLVSASNEEDSVFRFAKGTISDRGSADTRIKIEDDYSEYRYRSYLESFCDYLTQAFVEYPTLFTSFTMIVNPPDVLNRRVNWADVIQVEHPWQFPYVDRIADEKTPLVYSSHNFELDLFSELSNNILSKPLFRKVKYLEKYAAKEADLIIVTSEIEKEKYIKEFGISDKFHVAPNAAHKATDEGDIQTSKTDENIFDDFSAVFVGSDHPPNVDAVERINEFSKEKTVEDIQFVILGSVCSKFDPDNTPHNVHFLGFVESLSPYLSQSDIGINPVNNGAGSNVKIPTYFSYNLPVVATPFGARGVPGEPGEHYLQYNLAEFPNAIARLRDDDVLRSSLKKNADDLVSSLLNWENVSESVFHQLRKLTDE